MNGEITIGLFFFIIGVLSFWGSRLHFKEADEILKGGEKGYGILDFGDAMKFRIISFAFLSVGIGFIYDEIATRMGWPLIEDCFSMVANWLA